MELLLQLVNKQQNQIAELVKQAPVSADFAKEVEDTQRFAHHQFQIAQNFKMDDVLLLNGDSLIYPPHHSKYLMALHVMLTFYNS